jgi:GAF domain-containing protein
VSRPDLGERLARVEALLVEILERLPPQAEPEEAVERLLDAIGGYFGSAPFSVRGLLSTATEDPRGAFADALAAVIDLNAAPQAQAVSLGRLLARLPALEVVGASRGAGLYRLRESRE